MTLIEGGFGNNTSNARRRARRRQQTARVAAPLLIPLALALTLGIILAVSSGSPTKHINQQTSGITSSPARP